MDKKHYKVAQNKENGEKNENFQYIPLERVVLDPGMEFMGRLKCHQLLLKKKVKTLNNGVETISINGKVLKDFKG